MKNTNKHTPGPWINDQNTIEALADPENSKTYFAPVALVDHGWNKEITEANACLIAAAPDLLENLRRCEAALSWYIDGEGEADTESVTDARLAIARATNE